MESIAKVLALVILAAAISWPHRELHRSVPLEPGGRVYLKAYRGTVDVAGWDRPEVEIEARVRPGSLLGNQQACLEQTRLRVDVWPDSLRVTAEFPTFEENVPWWLAALAGRCAGPPQINYRLRIPRDACLRIGDQGSKIRVHGLAGPVEIRRAARQ